MIMAGGDLGLKKNRDLKHCLFEKAKKLDLLERIHFQEYEMDVERLIKSTDIVLNFSTSESFSFTCLEALRFGVPLIASDSGGPRELFVDGQSGLLVPNHDIASMSSAIIRLCQNPDLRRSFSTASRKFVSQKFDLTRSAQKLGVLYERLSRE
jgi:glycosyltransferase involved in cell wall biosynthesis